MAEKALKPQGDLVFGLDIGTRSIVGTVGYREGDQFLVVAQDIKEHETRAMLDGQIHDIGQVGNTITEVKMNLEKKLGVKLTDVCIAAAGRVLRTIETSVTWELPQETVITKEEIVSLTSLGIEKAYEEFQDRHEDEEKFYCVGNSVIRYYLNGNQISNLENHKAKSIGADIIATFLPDDVVDGLYKAVELAGLSVVNMTLEPIAAIAVAIPEMYRMLNIALVDVGAGTSDICITKDGCIIAYGMIPVAGDSLTEVIARNCLVDFNTAEEIKRGIETEDAVEYKDIMLLPQKITREDVLTQLEPNINSMTEQVAKRIMELNGGKAVSAVFVVGGGGKIAGYTEKLAEHLGIIKERVALRGEEVMQKIKFKSEARKDSLMVTPIGICLNYYEQSNSFIYVTFNENRVKLYDNGHLAVVDAAMAADYASESLFPRRGKEINYTLGGAKKICRGDLGEAAVIHVNGEETDLYHEVRQNDVIMVQASTAGAPAKLTLGKLPEAKKKISVTVNGSKILLPAYAMVNGKLQTSYYDVQDGDDIEILDYYTVAQVREFMDVVLDDSMTVIVNNEEATDETKVYEQFVIRWALKSEVTAAKNPERKAGLPAEEELPEEDDEEVTYKKTPENLRPGRNPLEEKAEAVQEEVVEDTAPVEVKKLPIPMSVIVNGRPITMKGKSEYVFVDVFDYIDFDTTVVQGTRLVTQQNGQNAGYLDALSEGSVIDIYWEK
ncbi:MAG: rod shape-determining protein [Lachnospiraceae bacterium]|nr:rod shape-determining protein [Lachnospiraceae bacterium]